jgi:hypothetical protein
MIPLKFLWTRLIHRNLRGKLTWGLTSCFHVLVSIIPMFFLCNIQTTFLIMWFCFLEKFRIHVISIPAFSLCFEFLRFKRGRSVFDCSKGIFYEVWPNAFFLMRFTLLNSYMIISYEICSYESNACVGKFLIWFKSYTIPSRPIGGSG